MSSSIWKISTNKIGTLQPFSSEYDMEAFILNNPKIVGCVGEAGNPCIIRQQITTAKGRGKYGRIDLIGLVKNDEDVYELRIFELKKGAIDIEAIEQIKSYLINWNEANSAKDNIEQWLTNEIGDEVSKQDIKRIISQPVGVVVGSRFLTDAVNEATNSGILGIRLARFSSSDKDFYVVIEDQIGTPSSRQVIGWGDLLKKGIITEKDVFITKINSKQIQVTPIFNKKSKSSKNVIFDKKTCTELLKKENVINKNIRHDYDKKRTEGLKLLSSRKGLTLTAATGLVYLAYQSDIHKSYWIPSPLWKLKRTNQLLSQLIEEAKD